MRTTPRALGASLTAVLAVGLTIAACSDSEGPVAPPVELPGGTLSALTCRASTQTLTVICQGPQLDAVGDQLIIGGQNQYVRMTSSNVQASSAGGVRTFSFDATVQNLLRNPWGAVLDADSFAAHPEGVRVFFQQAPVSAQGEVTVANPDGQGTFTGSETDYYQYNVVDRPTTADSMPMFLNEVSASKNWVFTMPDAVTSFEFTVLIATEVPFVDGWTDVVEDSAVWERALEDTVYLPIDGTQQLEGAVRSRVGKLVTGATIDYATSNGTVATVDASGLVTAESPGQAVVSGTSGVDKPSYRRTRVIVQSDLRPDSAWALENVILSIGGEGVLANDSASGTLAVVAETKATMGGGEVTLNADGTFTYISQAGETVARDSFFYRATESGVDEDSAQVIIKLDPRDIWFVEGGAADGNGTQSAPFGTVTEAQAVAADGDSILVMESPTDIDDLAVLKNGQALVGAGIPASITHTFSADPTAVNLNPGGVVTVLAAGTTPRISPNGAGAALTLANTNTVNGIDLNTFDGAGISGTSFGILTLTDVSVGADGPALSLTGGTANATFGVLTSSGSGSQGLFLSGVSGSITAASGTISSVTGAAIDVAGGAVAVSYPGAITQGSNAALLQVSGNHTGSVTLGGTLQATAGTGLQFNDADGSYTFSGTVTLNGGDAGVDIGNGSDGTFTFDDTDITSPTGTAFSVNGSTATVLHSGDITQANNALLLSVSEEAADSVVFRSGTLAATNGGGILLSNADGIVRFLGTVTLNGGDAGIDILAGSGGIIAFPAATTITNPTGTAINVFESAPTLTYPGTISANAGMAVVVDGASPCGSVTVSGNITSTGQGILVRDCSAGVVEFSGGTKSLSTGTNPAVSLISNTGGTVRFSGGGLAITTTTGAGFAASLGGEVTVTGANNTISSGTGTALNLNGVSTGASGVVFADVDNGAAAAAIILNNLTGVGATVNGGTISGTTGNAVQLTSLNALTSGVVLNNVSVTTNGAGIIPLAGNAFGSLSVSGTTLNATGGSAISLNTGSVSGTFAGLSSSGSTGAGATFTTVSGSLTVTAGTIAGGTGTAFLVTGGTLGGSVGADISQANNAALIQVTGGHNTGSITFGGAVSATNGSGLQFTDADGGYTFTGNLTLNGAGDEGIDLAASSGGTVTVSPSGGNAAAITSPSGVAIDVAGGSGSLTYNGSVTQANNAALLNVAGGHTGTISFPSGTITATNGSGLQFNNADGTYSFGGTVNLSNSVLNADAGIDITNGSGGTFGFPTAATITNPTGSLITIANSAPSFTYSGGLTKNNNATTAISIANNTGGSVQFNGDATAADGDPADVARLFSTSTATAISLSSNSGMAITFSGGGLNVTTTSGSGLSATGAGTLTVTGAGNTLTSTGGGTAVNIQNVSIGGSGISLLSVNASGGGGGIVLVNTGGNGLQVTGSGTHGSGGTLSNSSGGDGAVAGNGVYLDNASNVSLSWMNMSGHANHAIRGITVTNVTFNRLRITGANGTNAGFDEGAIVFTNLTGSASITASYIEGGFEDNVRVANTTGTLNRLTMTSDTIGHNGNSGNDGVLLDASSTATLNATIQSSRFTGSRSNNVHYVLNNSAAGDFVFANNVLTNNHPNKLGSDFGINVGSTSNGALTYGISGNSVRDAGGSGIEVSHLAGGNGPMTGGILNNTVGVAGVANSGSSAGSGIVSAIVGAGTTATHTSTITGNTVRQYTNYGIRLINRGTGNGYLNAIVKTNNIAEPSPNAVALFPAYSGIRAELGSTSGPPADDGRTCLDISGNTLNQTGSGTAADLRVFARFGTRTSLLGLGQGGASSVPNTFLANQNTITVAPGGFGAVNATSTNPFQASCPPV